MKKEEIEEVLELIQRDIDDICEFGYCNYSETYKTLMKSKELIKSLTEQEQPKQTK